MKKIIFSIILGLSVCGAAMAADTPTKLITKTITEGKGTPAKVGDKVYVHYTGWLYDTSAKDNKGKKFDSSLDRGEPFGIRLGQGLVIKGWEEGVPGMKIGEKRTLVIPPEKGYGERGAGDAIPANATLLFEVEMIKIISN